MRKTENEILERWERINIYKRLTHRTPHGLKYVVHDVPIPASKITDDILAAKVARDVYVKYKSMTGFNVIYSPEWNSFDHQVEKIVLGESDGEFKEADGTINLQKFRKACRRKALELIESHALILKRLGITADWEAQALNIESRFVSRVAEAIGRLFDKGCLSKEVKSLYWCFRCQEPIDLDEVRVGRKKAISAYVRLPLLKGLERFGRKVYLIVFSQEMWTFLGSSGVVAQDERYVAMLSEDGVYVDSISSPWTDRLNPRVMKEISPEELEGTICDHPITGREMPVIFAPKDVKRGECGFFAISPAHQEEDYSIASERYLEIVPIVEDDGRLSELAGDFCDALFDSVEERIRDELTALGYLMNGSKQDVRTFLCPECGARITFKPSVQWFFELRPISRRKMWGVPMTIIYCSRCGDQIISEEIGRCIKNSLNRRGVDSWFRLDPREFLGADVVCGRCDSDEFHKDEGMVDPMFASAVNQAWKLGARRDRSNIVDLIVEPEQIVEKWIPMLKRLLELLCDNDVLNSPIILNVRRSHRHKRLQQLMSKAESGDLVRLSIFLGPSKATEVYEDLRSLFKEILEVTKDVKGELNLDLLKPIDRLALRATDALAGEVMWRYESLNIEEALERLIWFSLDGIGSFYLIFARTNSTSALTLREITLDLLRLWAPAAPFMAEEIWLEINPDDGDGSILLSMMPLGWMGGESALRMWEALMKVMPLIEREKLSGDNVKVALPGWALSPGFREHLKDLEERCGCRIHPVVSDNSQVEVKR
jgi:isoleucyl-tRNA synthetase